MKDIMRFEGVLTAWNHEAGYGSIRAAGGGDEVFVSLAAFPTDGDGPRLDEPLTFGIVTGRDGRKHAVEVRRVPAATPAALRQARGGGRAHVRAAKRKRRLGLLAGAVLAVMLAVGGLRWWHPMGRGAELPVVSR
ncbi:cold-shock protein [Roseateles cellulosilyticus]|uniref:CSD domain-containing protein n=1 Tax=Pelomonas cellulosilytica TaxID=2906762 RepID=A0ABS8XYR1_9BURK|nr:hypothetical protein [Pelomonas sp. P8]MCE4557108.1 hypothetical protein [Pelomonas sp. P8]